MRKIETDEYTVSINDDPATRDAVFEEVIKFCIKHQSFSGESLIQNESVQIHAPELLSDIVDDILKIAIEYK